MKRIWVFIGFILIVGVGILTFLVVDKSRVISELEQENKQNQEETQVQIQALTDEISALNTTISTKESELISLTKNYDDSLILLDEKDISIADLTEQVDTLLAEAEVTEDEMLMDYASMMQLESLGIKDIDMIVDDLRARTELIGFEGVVGGTMRFGSIFVINDQWVYARFDDGHIMGYGLYKYKVEANMDLTWEVIDSRLDD
ncbi:MAG: hypothetical protein PF505_10795 [Vallitaleaceae bacterium]|jgi:predicted nuclease with TOPRIM domain|nr:hypothetical protein [Vallitaleaceae bacterium]